VTQFCDMTLGLK